MAGIGDLAWLIERPVAHRGLHDGNRAVPENSIPAAQRAVEAGYAIECDVQLSADGTPYVFHDGDLRRLTGADGAFRETSDARLQSLRLAGTDAPIPTLARFLDAVAGRVPIVLEAKGLDPDRDMRFFDRLAPLIRAYDGPLALMSFDDWLIDRMLGADLGRPVGLTAEGSDEASLKRHGAVFDRGCDFASYNLADLPNPFVEDIRNRHGAPALCWTVRDRAAATASRAHCDQITFEGFLPDE